MSTSIVSLLSKHLFHPLWDRKYDSTRLKTLKALMRSQWLSTEEIRAQQWQKLRDIILFAYDTVPYYRDLFEKQQITPHFASAEEFRRIPILSKRDIQRSGDRMISRSFDKSVLATAKTGGSTGKALTVYFDEHCRQMRNAAGIRSDRWAGCDLGMKRGALWGNPPVFASWKERLRNLLLGRTIYLDTVHLTPSSMNQFIARWRREGLEVLYGHAHSLYMLAQFARANKITDIRPRAIISTSMMLLTPERQVIEEAFNCKVTDRYGCEEVGLIASECEEHHGMHLNLDHLYVEFLRDDGTPVTAGEPGNIVVTDLVNRGMPLIRYRVEDIGVPIDRQCPCGRGLPLIERVTGRVADFLKAPDGSLIAGISLIERTLTAIDGIEQMQIVQSALDKLAINLVRGPAYTRRSEVALLREFRRVFGDSVSISVNYVDTISQDASGKYRFAICDI